MLDKDGKAILNPIEAMRQSNSLNLVEESDALKLPQSDYLERAKAKIKENQGDKETEKQRIKEKRLKKKRQLGKIIKEDESGEEMEVRLATPEESDDGYVSDEKPKKKQKKEKKEKREKKVDTGAKTAEERALELLDMDF